MALHLRVVREGVLVRSRGAGGREPRRHRGPQSPGAIPRCGAQSHVPPPQRPAPAARPASLGSSPPRPAPPARGPPTSARRTPHPPPPPPAAERGGRKGSSIRTRTHRTSFLLG